MSGVKAARWIVESLCGLLIIAVLAGIGVAFRTWQVGRQTSTGPADVIVVLGAAQYNGRPSPVFAARLDRAAELARGGAAPAVAVLGGGQPADRTTEGAAGAAYLEQLGIAATGVGEGRDTLSSLRAFAPIAAKNQWHRVLIVTDAEHANRSRLMAADLGFTVDVSGVNPDGRTSAAYYLRETAGSLFYLVIGGSSGKGGTVR